MTDQAAKNLVKDLVILGVRLTGIVSPRIAVPLGVVQKIESYFATQDAEALNRVRLENCCPHIGSLWEFRSLFFNPHILVAPTAQVRHFTTWESRRMLFYHPQEDFRPATAEVVYRPGPNGARAERPPLQQSRKCTICQRFYRS